MRMKSTILTVLGLGGVTLASGCSGSTSGEQSANPVPQDQFVTTFVNAVCDNIGDCCGQSGYAYDAAKCKSVASTQYGTLFKQSPNVVYDAEKAGSCIEAVKQAAAGCSTLDVDGSQACMNVYKGQLPAGAECNSSMECAAPAGGDASCEGEQQGVPGHCVVDARGMAGEGCHATCTEDGSSTSCGSSGGDPSSATCYTNDGLFCNAAYVCEKLAAVGAACQSGGCVQGAFCDSGTCAPLPVSGESCGNGSECAKGTYCSSAMTCTATKSAGDSCASYDECGGASCEEGVCQTESLASAAVCNGSSGGN
jgi:hypothetical protein